MRFDLVHYQRGKLLVEQVKAGGLSLEYGRQYRLACWEAIYRFVRDERSSDDPPAWDLIFALFPEDREALERRMLTMLKEVMFDASRQVLHHV